VSSRKPLTIADGATQQLQPGEELDIPLEKRFQDLQRKFRLLLLHLEDEEDMDLPDELIEEIKEL
jgi:hypothetical protein